MGASPSFSIPQYLALNYTNLKIIVMKLFAQQLKERGVLFKSLFFIISLFLFSDSIDAKQNPSKNTSPSTFVSQDTWNQVKKYLMPDHHPIKRKLDSIFLQARVLSDRNSMQAAGFTVSLPRHHNQMIIATHPKLKGYLIKAYLDEQDYFEGKPEHYYWIKRIKGTRLIRKFIKNHGYEELFKVPRKWIYFVPDEYQALSKDVQKNFILVVEDMHIFDDKTNEDLWGSDQVTQKLLKALYNISTELGLFDSTKPDNCPFSQDGKIAFIDTELYHSKRIKYYKLTPFLSPTMQEYWLKLTKSPQ